MHAMVVRFLGLFTIMRKKRIQALQKKTDGRTDHQTRHNQVVVAIAILNEVYPLCFALLCFALLDQLYIVFLVSNNQ